MQISGEIFLTKSSGAPRVKKTTYSYNGPGTFTLGPVVPVADTVGADGVVRVPDGDLVVGGQGDRVHKVNPLTGDVTTVTAGGVAAFHVALDPDLQRVWTSGIPGFLAEVPLNPFANGTARALAGDDLRVTHVAFNFTGQGYYTASDAAGLTGSFGRIDLAAFTTSRLLSNISGFHGMDFDPWTGHLITFGDAHILQIEPSTGAIFSDLDLSPLGVPLQLDQGFADGEGHLFVASNTGDLVFLDYRASGNVADPTNHLVVTFLETSLDDLVSSVIPQQERECGGRNPGSVLVYPVQRSGPRFFTVVSVTNTNTDPAVGLALGGTTNVHFEYVNAVADPGDPFRPLDCTVFDRVESLTPADTLSVLTACHNAFAPGGQEGYLVVSAQDPSLFDTPWSHNFLIGSEIVLNASGGMYQIQAIPFCSPRTRGAPTDTAPANGRLDFNGNEYGRVPDVLYVDSFLALGGSQLALLNLTGGPRDINTILLSVWNDNEFPLSATLSFNCWFDQPLTGVSPLFSHAFLHQNTPHDPDELDVNCDGWGEYETGWAQIDSIDVSQPFGGSIASDGAILGSITAGPASPIDGGKLLWESKRKQRNGRF